ncbi:DUF3102 domain-containing protein [Ligilactobacillus acidipiscis]|uniref:DUF3102 domain-containing protein n=1 Tax=Ligilactobacillus acidipiscis TaxID=89059 RepID=UPI000705189B|nr:DUF3102 domain-containing protein [Ligilactobacillus acidipiscis]GAW63101.1 hypothetical protein Lacidipiscis_00283 [Ligilactobacillus acidipiscis]GEN19696.1 hypothetical protein LAC02_29770 [Ligilactobacillus acidipiscis]
MQEVALSNDLTQLTTEIKTYQSIGGQAIFEIGRRLKKVKEEDLAHGQYLKWLESINMDRTMASRFIKVSSEKWLNDEPVQHLGVSVLYELTKIPTEMRNEPQQLDSGETKKPVDMTRREIQELNHKLKQSEDARQTLNGVIDDKSKTITALEEQVKNKPAPEIVEKEIEKVPDDYEQLKQQASDAQAQLKKAQEDLEFYQREVQAYERIRKNDEANDKFDEQQEHELRSLKVQTSISIYSLIRDIQKFLREENVLTDISKINDLDNRSKSDLQEATDGLQRFVDNVNQIIEGRRIVEGKFSE